MSTAHAAGSGSSDAATSASAGLPPGPSATPTVPPAPVAVTLDISDAPLAAEIEGGAAHVRARAWSKAKAAFAGTAPVVDKRGNVDEMLGLHAMLGRVSSMLGDNFTAEAEYGKVIALWNKSDTQTKLDAMGGSPAERSHRTAKSATAVGEALFFMAENERKKAEQIKAPGYGGDGSVPDVNKHINGRFKDWMHKRRAAVDAAEKRYRLVAGIKPVAPPVWIVASAERVAAMQQAFVDAMLTAPLPRDWNGNKPIYGGADAPPGMITGEEVKEAYLDAVGQAMLPQRQAIRAAYTVCSETAAKFGVKTAAAAACDKWHADHP